MSEEEAKPTTTETPKEEESKKEEPAAEEVPKEEESTATFEPVVRRPHLISTWILRRSWYKNLCTNETSYSHPFVPLSIGQARGGRSQEWRRRGGA